MAAYQQQHYTVCIVNANCPPSSPSPSSSSTLLSTTNSTLINKTLTDLHAAVTRLHAKASIHVLYSTGTVTGTPPQASFVTHVGDTVKFGRKLADSMKECGACSEVVVVEGVRKMVGVWKRKAGQVDLLVDLLVVGEENQYDHDRIMKECGVMAGVRMFIDRVSVDSNGDGIRPYLCQKYHLRPVFVDTNNYFGLVRMPWLELPVTSSAFADRKLTLHRLHANTSMQLVIASHRLPMVCTAVNVQDHEKFMDEEGRVYEYVNGDLYRRVADCEDAAEEVSFDEILELIITAHLLHNSVVMLWSPFHYMCGRLQSYTPVLFNPTFPILQQLSMVLVSAASSTSSMSAKKAETDMLSQLLQAVANYNVANSPDLFHVFHGTTSTTTVNHDNDSIMTLYKQLRVELEMVGRVAPALSTSIAGAFQLVDEATRLAKKSKEEPGDGCISYLSVVRPDKPPQPSFKNPLLSTYYRLHCQR